MDSAKNQLVDKLKTANNILVTVSRNPSVDQLSALLGLTLILNKQGKHTAAVYSGETPSTLEFLKPEETIEKNTDSLRDFIIALDKSKADKLRYKVEDNVVRIFITPYKTSISQDDLEFSQGDFNVDVVVALGVKQQEDLDEAITAHGRILHDAAVASINTSSEGGLGSINWQDPQASSLSELVTELAQAMGDNVLDNQISTALLTGIVAETNRFSNEKTSSLTMSASAALMAAGANQQLVATKLEEGDGPAEQGAKIPANDDDGDGKPPKSDDGTLDITHEEKSDTDKKDDSAILPAPNFDEPEEPTAENDEKPEGDQPQTTGLSDGSKLITSPPTLGGTLTANTQQNDIDPVTDPLSMPTSESPQILNRDSSASSNNLGPLPSETPAPEPAPQPEPAVPPVVSPAPSPAPAFTPPPAAWTPPTPPTPPADPLTLASEEPKEEPKPETPADSGDHTLAELEQSVHSTHAEPPKEQINAARDEVSKALASSDAPVPPPSPIEALGAQPLGGSLHNDLSTPALSAPSTSGLPSVAVGPDGTLSTQPPVTPPPLPPTDAPQVVDPTAPPPVPPPLNMPFNTPPPAA